MSDRPHPLDYEATLDRLEPGIAPVDPMISLASLAISARAIHSELASIHDELRSLRNNIISVSPNIHLGDIARRLEYLNVLADMKKQLETIVKGLTDG